MPLPFDLPALSRGFAALTPAASAAGARAAEAAAAALAALLDRDVSIKARATPGAASPRAAVVRLSLDLAAVPAAAVLEVEPAAVVALLDALAGGPGAARGATALTPIEASALELFALAALGGACSIPEIERALAPRLSRGGAEPPSPLAVELDFAAGAIAGRGRLLVPAAALAALRDPFAPPTSTGTAISIPVSVRSGRAPLALEELAALSPGDVVLLDAPGGADDVLVLPGGSRLTGRLEGDGFSVKEVAMSIRSAQLPVVLEVELARVEVSLAEIVRLEPGAVLALGIDRRGVVTLKVGERAVAKAELVEVEGAVGVRVLSTEGSP